MLAELRKDSRKKMPTEATTAPAFLLDMVDKVRPRAANSRAMRNGKTMEAARAPMSSMGTVHHGEHHHDRR